MIVSTIRQFGLRLRADPEEIPFQYSANVQMKFEKDENYNDYTVVGYYIPPGESEAKLLSINDDGTFTLGPDCFKQRGTLSFSFNLINSQEEVHLGSIDFEIRYAFGDGDTILPEPEEVWISLVTKVAKDAIKDDVAVVQQKAKEALQSASLANDKANEAQEYANNANQSANSASLSASSALTAKNDAIAASNSAIQAKQDAEQSANNAKNSANTALENANKSTEAIETVTQIKTEIENKANDFDTNYQEKLKSFNDNATSKQNAFDNSVQTANTNFDNKVTQANSDLDAKVQEATKQAQKAKEEADRATQATDGKLDKNLGVENAGKSLVVGENGEVVCGESGINEDEVNKIIDKAIDEKLYTQEEVDYLLADKMDKPYVPIEITDNATIDDALAGNFKIDKIKGNTYQNVEENIVPTPQRPVPINSRKVLANGEYVELRSLKESNNLFDNRLFALLNPDYFSLNDDGTGIKIIREEDRNIEDIQYEISIRGLFYCHFICSGGLIITIYCLEEGQDDWRVVRICNDDTTDVTFSVGNSNPAKLKFEIHSSISTETANIALYSYGVADETKYVPPTVRDYKIVDHTSKTSKIVRNVLEIDANNIKAMLHTSNEKYISFQLNTSGIDANMLPQGKIGYCSLFLTKSWDGLNDYEMVWIATASMGISISKDRNISDVEQFLQFVKEKDIKIFAKLATPTEESIPYVETDTSEVGLSWQDTTSPSPDIESKIYEVDEINIKLVNKNLFDYESKTKGYITNWNSVGNKISFTQTSNTDFATFVSYDVLTAGTNIIYKVSSNVTQRVMIVFTDDNDIILKSDYRSGPATTQSYSTTIPEKCTKIYICILDNGAYDNTKIQVQIEEGAEATPYEPHQETSIQHTLSKPLRAVDGFEDVINILENKIDRKTLKIDITTLPLWVKGSDLYDKENTTARYGSLETVRNVLQFKGVSPILKNPQIAVWQVDVEGFTTNAGYQIHVSINNDRLNVTKDDTSEKRTNKFVNYINSLKGTGKEFIYVPLNVTTEEPLEDELVQKLKTLKTFSPTTHVFVTGIAKPKLNAKYPKDIAAAQAQLEAKVVILQEAVIKNV